MTLAEAVAYLGQVEWTKPDCDNCGLALGLSGCYNCQRMATYNAKMDEVKHIFGGEAVVNAVLNYMHSFDTAQKAQKALMQAEQKARQFFT